MRSLRLFSSSALAPALAPTAASSVHSTLRRGVLPGGDGRRFGFALVTHAREKKNARVLCRRCRAVRTRGIRGRSKSYQVAHGYAPERLRSEDAPHGSITLGEG
jgi:hypothetical protein